MAPPRPDSIAEWLVDLAAERDPACGGTRVISIDGPSGSGKTSLANYVAEMSDATVLHLEDLYQGWHGLESAPPAAAAILQSVAVGEIGHAANWDWEASRLGPEVTVAPCPLLIIEGVGAGAEAIAPFVNLLVWVDGDVEARRARALSRDGDTYAPWWDIWAEQEQKHFARERTPERADVQLRSE